MTDIYTPEQAAVIVGLTARTLIKRCNDGVIKGAKRHGRQWVLPAEVVEAERQRMAGKSNKKAPDRVGLPGQQITLNGGKRPPRAKPANEYTAPVGVASEAELAENRARLDTMASTAKTAVYIGIDGRARTIKRSR